MMNAVPCSGLIMMQVLYITRGTHIAYRLVSGVCTSTLEWGMRDPRDWPGPRLPGFNRGHVLQFSHPLT
jgi:hypothetical protein